MCVLLLVFSSICTGASVTVNGHRGESFDIRCPYEFGYESYSKYLCKGECNIGNKNVMVESGSPAKDKRFSLTDNTTARVFTVTITDLRTEDEGQYWCAVKRTLPLHDIYSEILLQVKLAPQKTRPVQISASTLHSDETVSSFSNTPPHLSALDMEPQSTIITITVRSSVCLAITVRGTEGEQVTIKCPYDHGYENSYKYFYKGLYRDNNVILKSYGAESSVFNGRFSLRDDHQMRSFTVTIRNLSMEDAGPYGCIAGWGEYKQIQLNVIKAPQKRRPVQISTTTILMYTNTSPDHTSTDLASLAGGLGSVLLVLILCSGQFLILKKRKRKSGTGASVTVNGHRGESFDIRCPYEPGYESYSKYLCKGECNIGNKNIMVESGSPAKDKRFSLTDNTTARVFTITITDLRTGDEGQYCTTEPNLQSTSITITERKETITDQHNSSTGDILHTGSVIYVSVGLVIMLTIFLLALTVWCRKRSKKSPRVAQSGHLQPGAVTSMSVTGHSGGEINITCTYKDKYRENAKYFCKGPWLTCSNLIKTDIKNKWVNDGRFSLYDDTRAAVFTVTIRNLSEWNSGTYYCAVDKSGIDSYTEVKLNIITGSSLIIVVSVVLILLILGLIPCIVTFCKKHQARAKGLVTSVSVTGYSGGVVDITCKYERKYKENAKSAAVLNVTIRDLSLLDSGKYRCAFNKPGIYFYTEVNLTVISGSSLIIGLSAIPILLITGFVLAIVAFCKRSSGSDLCAEETSVEENRRWSAEGQIQLYDDREQQLLTGTISHVTQQHSAEYWCGVQSDQGHKSFITRVLISVTGVVSSISVTGYSGGGVIITCRYDREYTDNAKYFCRGLWTTTCSDLIKTEEKEKWVDKGRFSLYDDISAAVFTVTIRDLSEQDSGTYQCGVDKSGQTDSYTEVNLKVLTADCCVKSISLSAAAGGSVNISCKYPQSHSADVKFVCRRSGSDLCAEETSVKENRRWSAEGQIQLYDDREQQLLTGTISHVTQQHSAEYWCGVQSDQGHKSFITRVLISVTGSSLIIPLVLLALIITGLLLLFLFKKHQSRATGDSQVVITSVNDLNYTVVNFQKKADCPDSVSLRNNQDFSEYAAVNHHTA
ncbi:polymeric immunoglobulin receptor-like protein [Labeo rohita]|nr:polymeric immunoglobulin receptor-like protein [Labeo rohita]